MHNAAGAFFMLQTAKSKREKRVLKDRVEAARFENSVAKSAFNTVILSNKMKLSRDQYKITNVRNKKTETNTDKCSKGLQLVQKRFGSTYRHSTLSPLTPHPMSRVGGHPER
jgi:hypothetical protein